MTIISLAAPELIGADQVPKTAGALQPYGAGAVASKIKTLRKIEPYKGKGIREKGQYVLKKEGKKK